MRTPSITATLMLALAAGRVAPGAAQEAPDTTQASPEAIRVFLDCQTFYCDFDHFRREITFVNWMRDRQDAQVHVLGTQQPTGGGGRDHTLTFIGLREFAGRVDTLSYVSSNTDTEAEIRDGLVHTVKMGLMRYVAGTPSAGRISITYEAPSEEAQETEAEDPWNLWVFQIRVGGYFNGETNRRYVSGNGSIGANRTDENFKLELGVYGRYSRDETDVPEQDTTYVNTQERYDFDGLAVWSLGPHWSAGAIGRVSRDTFVNQLLAVEAGPAIEYNIWPYDESTRRALTFLYTIGVAAFEYEEITAYGKTSETLPKHVLDIDVSAQQPWGSIDGSVEVSQYLHDLTKHRIDLYGGFSIRLARGFDLSFWGGVSRVKDQLFISGIGLTTEERLLRTRQSETDFFYYGNVNFSFRFGSKFANIVNPRM